MQITYEVDMKRCDRILAKAGEKLTDLRKPLADSATYMYGSIGKNFRSQGRPNKWQKLAKSTLRKRRKHGSGARILQDTGQLRMAVTSNTHPNSIYKLSRYMVTFGVKRKGAPQLQRGAVIMRKKRRQNINWRTDRQGRMLMAPRPRYTMSRKQLSKAAMWWETFNVGPHVQVIPARPYMLFQESDKRAIQRIFVKYVKELFD